MIVFLSNKDIFVDENRLISTDTKTGNVYLFDERKVIKIFKYINHEYNDYLKNKLNILRQLNVNKFITPMEIVYDEYGNVIGYTMKYVNGKNGYAILNYSSKFLLEELEKIYKDMSILSTNNIVIDDLTADNVIINNNGIYFIDVDDYIIRTKSNYDKNMMDSNFNLNRFFKEMFFKTYLYRKNDLINKMFNDYSYFYDEASKLYKPNQSVKSLVRSMIKNVR